MYSSFLTLLSPAEMAASLAHRMRVLRLAKGLTRKTLARRAGVTASSLKRFETTGKASLELVLKTAHTLARLEDFNGLLLLPEASSMEELELRTQRPIRKRGRI